MTFIRSKEKEKRTKALLVFVLCVIFCIITREALSDSISFGIKLAASSIIPSLFPFFVISDFLSKNSDCLGTGALSKVFEKIFGLPRAAHTAFILGNICGFPLGVRFAGELYEKGYLTKKELERTAAISNNPSLAFCVSAVGGGMLGDIFLGSLLYLSVVFSSVIIGVITRSKCDNLSDFDVIFGQRFVLSDSIKAAGFSSITVSSFIIFFSGVLGIVKSLFKSPTVALIFGIFLEVGGASASIISSPLDKGLILPLLAFTLAFSGLSVFFQALCFLPSEISRAKLLFFKLLQGILAAIIVLLLSFFVL